MRWNNLLACLLMAWIPFLIVFSKALFCGSVNIYPELWWTKAKKKLIALTKQSWNVLSEVRMCVTCIGGRNSWFWQLPSDWCFLFTELQISTESWESFQLGNAWLKQWVLFKQQVMNKVMADVLVSSFLRANLLWMMHNWWLEQRWEKSNFNCF